MASEQPLDELVASMAGWFDSMRGPRGYGGPVSHWWRDSLRYCGVGLDWRYEGIITGHLTLWRQTGRDAWLDRAQRAGDDLVAGQLDTGNFRASAFERNPETVGTPHEATASIALLRLARALDDAGRDPEPYLDAAKANLAWHEDELWLSTDETFSDSPGARSLVPNKAVSTAEAFFELAKTTGEDDLIQTRVVPALDAVLDLQVTGGPHRGAIHQLGLPENGALSGDGKFFPIYIARCIPHLLEMDEYVDGSRFRDAAVAAGEFLKRVQHADGSFPAVVYQDGSQNRYPKWIAGLGDVLRAFDALSRHGHEFDTEQTAEWLFDGYDSCGAFRTASGFARIHGRDTDWSFSDVVHVVGWNDKAYRWLTERVTGDVRPVAGESVTESTTQCRFDSAVGTYSEDDARICFHPTDGDTSYEWEKGTRWASVSE
jgi:hypothetical protein